MAATVINGSDLMLFYNSKSIALATSHKLTISSETNDISSKDSDGGGLWKAESIKSFSWEATTENLYSTDQFETLYDAMIAKTPVDALFGVKTDASGSDLPSAGSWTAPTNGCWKGKVIITSLEANAANGDNATFSATFTGYGALTHTASLTPSE